MEPVCATKSSTAAQEEYTLHGTNRHESLSIFKVGD
jgi:hypothetical protein